MNQPLDVAGHQLTLLRNGEEYFPRLLAAIAGAQHSLYLETYIFAPDQEGRWVAEALGQAAQRGVRVHLLLDGFGSANLPEGWVERMRGAGIDVRWFRQELGRFNFRRHRLRRLHRKLVVVDGRMGFVGGINIINDISPGANQPRLDYAVEVVGPVVHDMHAAARRLWALVSWSQLRRRGDRDALPRQLRSDTRQKVSFLLRDNFRHRRDIERAYLRAIGQAQHEIVLANAYFLPGRKFRNALVNAAKREGVRVVVLLQGRVDHWLQHYATRALYGQLLHAGVEIYEYHASFLHAKVAVVDGHWATVGSSNIDPLSLLLAREGNLVVRDKDFAAALRGDLMSALTHGSHRVQVKQWRHANPLMRLLAWMSYGVVRLLAGWGSHVRGREL